MSKLVLMQIFTLLFKFPDELLIFLIFLGTLGPKLVTWRHARGQNLKILTFWHNNRIPDVKISLNANFYVFKFYLSDNVSFHTVFHLFHVSIIQWNYLSFVFWLPGCPVEVSSTGFSIISCSRVIYEGVIGDYS